MFDENNMGPRKKLKIRKSITLKGRTHMGSIGDSQKAQAMLVWVGTTRQQTLTFGRVCVCVCA